MKVETYSHYSKLYESKLRESNFLIEQNLTSQDIIAPLHDLITEEFIKKWIQRGAKAIGDIAKNVKDAVSKVFSGVVNFFKNFSLKKLKDSIAQYVKNTELYKKIKQYLSGFSEFIIQNNLVNDDNTPNFKNIWSVICSKSKQVEDFENSGLDDTKLQTIGSKIKINEADEYSISEEEIKYYGFFEKLAYKLGIKNARFNGVISQIMQKTTIGLAIMGLLKLAGITLGGFGIMTALGPVAVAAIGGMLLMAGLIILAIWVCKPYPTLDDCLAYLHMAFGGRLEENEIENIFIIDVSQDYQADDDKDRIELFSAGNASQGESGEDKLIKSEEEDSEKKTKPFNQMYPVMIKNLTALKAILDGIDEIKIEGETESKSKGDKSKTGKGSKSTVGSPRFSDKNVSSLQDSFNYDKILKFAEILEKDYFGKTGKVNIAKNEFYLISAIKNLRKSINILEDKSTNGFGITSEFINDILSEKLESRTKDSVKALYKEIYEYLYGNKSKTMSDLGPLYKESVDIISKASSRQAVAEKIARFSKRSTQFEGEGFYSGLGSFGDALETFNTTLKELTDSLKSESKAV